MIFENLLILGINEAKGEILESVAESLESVLAGAVLAELVLQNRVDLRNNRVVIIDPSFTDHPILDKALSSMLEKNRPRKLRYWINILVFEEYFDLIGQNLVLQGVLLRRRKQLSFAVSEKTDTNKKESILFRQKAHLHEIVLGNANAEIPDIVLLAFLYYADLLILAFEGKQRRKARKNIKKLLFDENDISNLSHAMETIVEISCK